MTADSSSPVRVAFCLMVHDQAAKVGELAALFEQAGHGVFVHLDASVEGTRREEFIATVRKAAAGVRFVTAVKCEWGCWSLAQGVLNLLDDVVQSGVAYTHVQLLSAADLPTQDLGEFGKFLQRNSNRDFIEAVDITVTPWAVHGPELERFHYYFPFNWRRQRTRFDIVFFAQKLFGFKRKMPCGMRPRLGSQWWTLRMSTCRKILSYLTEHPEIIPWFQHALIPDECFFQSLVAHLIDPLEIVPRTLTLYKFGQYGKPFVFYDDHHDWLITEPFFFARKVSPTAKQLERKLMDRARSGEPLPWQDARAGFRSLELMLEAQAAYQLVEPFVGFPGICLHQAFQDPTQTCHLLVCADQSVQDRVIAMLANEGGIHVVNPAQLPPHRPLKSLLLPPLASFLANEINLPGVATCVVTTPQSLPAIVEALEVLEKVPLSMARVNGDGANTVSSAHAGLLKNLPGFSQHQPSSIIAWLRES